MPRGGCCSSFCIYFFRCRVFKAGQEKTGQEDRRGQDRTFRTGQDRNPQPTNNSLQMCCICVQQTPGCHGWFSKIQGSIISLQKMTKFYQEMTAPITTFGVRTHVSETVGKQCCCRWFWREMTRLLCSHSVCPRN